MFCFLHVYLFSSSFPEFDVLIYISWINGAGKFMSLAGLISIEKVKISLIIYLLVDLDNCILELD